jgi:general secretion pathway protein D
MKRCRKLVGKFLQRGWLLGPVIFLIILGVTGSAPGQTSGPAQPPAPGQTTVRVLGPSPKPAAPSYEQLVQPAQTEAPPLAEQDLEDLSTRIKTVPVARRACPPGEQVYPIDLNLKNADLVETIRVLADTIGLNYNIDPKVKGTVNVRATGKLTRSDLLSIIETILTINGATLIKTNGLYNIVPSDKAASRGLPVYSRGRVPPGMRAQVVFLEQTPAKEVEAVLKPLLSPAGSLGLSANNSLVLVDTPDNLDKLLGLIHLMDTRALADTSVRVIQLHNSDPNEVIKELESIFSTYGSLAQKGKDNFGVGFLPVARLNSVMILASSRPLADRALYWVRQLDARTDPLANMHVYHVVNYKAKNLADILTQVYGGAPSAPKIKETKSETGVGLGMTSTLGGAGGMGAGAGGMGAGAGGMGQPQSMLGGAPAGTMGMVGGGAGTALGAGGALGGEAAGAAPLKERAVETGGAAAGTSPKEGVRIIPDEENNLLVVVAPSHEWTIISGILQQLDIMPREVMCEVQIAEVRLSRDLSYGIEFLIGATPAQIQASTGTTTNTNVPSGVLVTGSTTPTTPATSGVLSPTPIAGVTAQNAATAAFTAAGGLTFVAIDTANKLRGIINLLSTEGRVKILATPHITAANNQEARIMIGQEVPILTSQSVPLVSQATSFQTSTVQYRNTGIILSVKPQINAKGLVTMEIAQEVSDAQSTTTGVSGTPTFSVRQTKTSLITADNQTVFLGGLIREDNSKTQAGIPGLRRLPGVGPFFGSTGISKQRTELIVLITPHIISNLAEGAHITHEMKEKINLQETMPRIRKPQAPAVPTPPGPQTAPRAY